MADLIKSTNTSFLQVCANLHKTWTALVLQRFATSQVCTTRFSLKQNLQALLRAKAKHCPRITPVQYFVNPTQM